MKYLTILLFCTLLVLSVQAQIPGYMGKRSFLVIDLNPSPAINQNVNNTASFDVNGVADASKISLLAFNYRPQVSFEYLISRDVAIGLNYSLLQTGVTRAYDEGPVDPNDFDHSYDADVLKGHSIGFNVRIFRFNKSASIAPIGLYKNIRVEYATVNTYDDKKSSESLFVNDFKHFIITYGMGKQSVKANTVIFRYGFEFGYAIVPGNFFFETPEWTAQEESGYNVHGSLFGYYVLSVKLGIGSLLF